MANKVLCMTKEGKITYCTASPENRGKGRCNHIAHQEENESIQDFMTRVSTEITEEDAEIPKDSEKIIDNPVTMDDIQKYKDKICEIAGRDDIDLNNLNEVISSLPPDKQLEIVRIGFEASEYFAFPITDEEFEDEKFKTDIYFSNMYKYGIGAKENHIREILGEIGETVEEKGSGNISNNYLNGLTDEEYWSLQYATRMASVNKTVSISAPGAAVYKNQLVEVTRI